MDYYTIVVAIGLSSYTENVEHYTQRTSLEALEAHWKTCVERLKAGNYCAVMLYHYKINMETGEVFFEKIRHEKRALVETLVLNQREKGAKVSPKVAKYGSLFGQMQAAVDPGSVPSALGTWNPSVAIYDDVAPSTAGVQIPIPTDF